jgi:hypothetical protein
MMMGDDGLDKAVTTLCAAAAAPRFESKQSQSAVMLLLL